MPFYENFSYVLQHNSKTFINFAAFYRGNDIPTGKPDMISPLSGNKKGKKVFRFKLPG